MAVLRMLGIDAPPARLQLELEAPAAGPVLDIERYFQGFVISEVMGCCKPDPRMYAAGSDLLGLAPRHCLFVDDDPDLVSAAVDLGYDGGRSHA